MRNCFSLTILFLSCVASIPAGSTLELSDDSGVKAVSVITGLQNPWAVVPLGDGNFLISLKKGELLYIENGRKYRIRGMPKVAATGQGGLLDLALSPDFPRDSLLYFSFSMEDTRFGGYSTAVGRGRLYLAAANRHIGNVEIIYQARPGGEGGLHFGSRLAFDREGYLYVTLGERGSMQRAQDRKDPYGSVLRLNPDGTIPANNPFQEKNEAREIWSYGHRNAQGMALHPETGEVWIHEHGPKGGDELNIVRRGANYGWPVTTHGINYNGTIISKLKEATGIEKSVTWWVPSIAPSGMTFYQGNLFPQWEGNIFLGALAGQHLRRIALKDGKVTEQQVLFPQSLGRIRDVRTGKDGHLYLLTDGSDSTLYRLSPG